MKTRRSSTGSRSFAGKEEVFHTPAQTLPETFSSSQPTPKMRLTRGALRQWSSGEGELFYTPPQSLSPPFNSPPSTQSLAPSLNSPQSNPSTRPTRAAAKRLLEKELDLRTPSPKRLKVNGTEEINIITPPEERQEMQPAQRRAKPTRKRAATAHEPRKLEQLFESPSDASAHVSELPLLETPTGKAAEAGRRQLLNQSRGSPSSTVTTASPVQQTSTRPKQEQNASPSSTVTGPLPSNARKTRRSSVSVSGPSTLLENHSESREHREKTEALHFPPCSPPPPNCPSTSSASPASVGTPVQKRGRKKEYAGAGGGAEGDRSIFCAPQSSEGFQARLESVALEPASPVAPRYELAGAQSVETGSALLTEDCEVEAEGVRPKLPEKWSSLGGYF
jgi:hypothetical protein